ncbi:MAG: hypothetical protein N2D54_07280, partial [Chloroflexota bacterium]
YEHLGDITVYVEDLHALWQKDAARRNILITPDDAHIVDELEIPFPVSMVWEAMTKPESRNRVFGGDGQEPVSLVRGLIGEGTSYHCAHGDILMIHQIIDWEPFEYYTFDFFIDFIDLTSRFTFYFSPTENGTRARFSARVMGEADQVTDEKVAKFSEVYSGAHQMLLGNIANVLGELIAEGEITQVAASSTPKFDISQAAEKSLQNLPKPD